MFTRFACCCGLLVACSATFGQDIDIFVSTVDGVLTVDGNADTPGEGRTYIPRFNSFYSVNDPGLRAAPGELENNAALEWDFLPMTIGGLTSTLLYWDGQGGTPDFGPTPNIDYSLSLFGRNFARAKAAGESELVPGEIFDFASSVGSLHEHRSFFLDNDLSDENFTDAEPGFYLIAMRFRSEGRERSDPFYMAWGTPDSDINTQRDTLLPWLQERVDTLVLPGDHNFDGVVDAADYTVWREGFGTTHSQRDADQWRDNFGAVAEGAAAAFSVPEPVSATLLALGASLAAAGGRRRLPNR